MTPEPNTADGIEVLHNGSSRLMVLKQQTLLTELCPPAVESCTDQTTGPVMPRATNTTDGAESILDEVLHSRRVGGASSYKHC